jgi:hypothetical protein
MNGRYQRRRERRAAEKYMYDEIDTWNLQKINPILSNAKKDKALAQRLIDYYLPILQAIDPDTPYGLEHLRELPEYISGLENIRQSSQAEFYFKLIGFYLLKKKIPLVKEFVRNYPPDKVNTLRYCHKNIELTLCGIILYEKFVAELELTEQIILPCLPDLKISNLSFYADRPTQPIVMPFKAKILARHLQKLSSLSINNAAQLEYFEPSQLNSLKSFYAKELSLKDITLFLSQLSNIEEILCRNLKDIEDLEHLASSRLKKLHIQHTYCYKDESELTQKILDLTHLPHLQDLIINNFNIVDIDKIRHLTELKYLDLSDNNIEDISPLLALKNLRRINLCNNKIADISPLMGLNSDFTVHAARNKLNVCPPFELIRRLAAKDISSATQSPNKQLSPRQEPPNASKIWQLLYSKDPTNTELALQLAKGLGWTADDIQPYTHIIKKWL